MNSLNPDNLNTPLLGSTTSNEVGSPTAGTEAKTIEKAVIDAKTAPLTEGTKQETRLGTTLQWIKEVVVAAKEMIASKFRVYNPKMKSAQQPADTGKQKKEITKYLTGIYKGTHSTPSEKYQALKKASHWTDTTGNLEALVKDENFGFWDQDGKCLLEEEVQKELFDQITNDFPITRDKLKDVLGISESPNQKTEVSKEGKKYVKLMRQFICRKGAEVTQESVKTAVNNVSKGYQTEGVNLTVSQKASQARATSDTLKKKENDRLNATESGNHCTVEIGDDVATRSSRSDTAGRILDDMVQNLKAQNKAKNPKGIHRDPENPNAPKRFKMCISTGMDDAVVKSQATKVKGKITGEQDDERELIGRIFNARDQLFGDRDEIEMEVDGETYIFEKPIIVIGSQHQTGSFSMDLNKADFKRLSVDFNSSIDKLDKSTFSEKGQEIVSDLKKAASTIDFSEKGIPENFKNGEVKNKIAALPEGNEKEELMSLYLSTEALCINLTGKTLEGTAMNGTYDAPKIATLNMSLFERLNIAEHFECKSGCDRTQTYVSLSVAKRQFKAITKREFNPLSLVDSIDENAQDLKDYQLFSELFQNATKQLGGNVVGYVRGEPKLKWGRPTSLFYDSSKKEPIKGIKGTWTGQKLLGIGPKVGKPKSSFYTKKIAENAQRLKEMEVDENGLVQNP